MSAARIDEVLAEARRGGLDRLDAQLLLAHVLQCPRTALLAHGEDPVPAAALALYASLVQRRGNG